MRRLYLRELFDNPVDYEITLQRKDQFEAMFEIEDLTYEFLALYTRDHTSDRLMRWEISFEIINEEEYEQIFTMTGTGNQFLVFSTVGKLLYEFIDRYNPEEFEFSSVKGEENRSRLYDIFAKRFAKETGYSYEVRDAFDEMWFVFFKE